MKRYAARTALVLLLSLGSGIVLFWQPGTSNSANAIPPAPKTTSDNWPQWRGQHLNGTASVENLPVEWDRTRNVRWSTPLPAWSGSSPIVWNDTIFVTSPAPQKDPAQGRRDPGGDQIFLLAIERANGSVRWRQVIGTENELRMKQNMASPSPATDGDFVWAMSGHGDLVAFDFEGTQRWKRNLQEDYGRFGFNFGFAASPLLYEDRLIIPVLHGMKTNDPSYLLAINKRTGKTLWKTVRPTNAIAESPDAYTTPQVFRRGGKAEIIVNGGDVVTAHDPDSGKEIWRIDGLNPKRGTNYRIVGSPVISNDIIIAPTRVEPMLAIRPNGDGAVTNRDILWKARGADVPTPVTNGKLLWVVTDRGVLNCLDIQTGKDMYPPQRLERGTYSASPVLADGKVYVLSEDGATSVIEAGPVFRVLSVNRLEDAYTLSTPAIAQGEIFIRTSDRLYCIAQL